MGLQQLQSLAFLAHIIAYQKFSRLAIATVLMMG
jgi:hypothetical protein